MAGGPFAAVIVCDHCRDDVRPAFRVYEGSEDDSYRCALGHTFGIHWRTLPGRPMWPTLPPDEVRAAAYRRWLARCEVDGPGDADGDWHAAEQDLRRALVRGG